MHYRDIYDEASRRAEYILGHCDVDPEDADEIYRDMCEAVQEEAWRQEQYEEEMRTQLEMEDE